MNKPDDDKEQTIELTVYDGTIAVEKPNAHCIIVGLSVPQEEDDHARTRS